MHEADHTDLSSWYAILLATNTWDLYTTTTYRVPRRDPLRAANAFWQIMSNKFSAERAFVAVESHRLDGLHIHALTSHELRPELRASSVWKYLHKANGRTTVEPPRGGNAALVSWYCAKYVTKADPDRYFFFGDNWVA